MMALQPGEPHTHTHTDTKTHETAALGARGMVGMTL